MKVIKKTEQFTIYQKRSGRYAVESADKSMINGDEKAQILLAEGLIKLSVAAAPEAVEEVAEETTEEAPAEAAEEEAKEEKPAE